MERVCLTFCQVWNEFYLYEKNFQYIALGKAVFSFKKILSTEGIGENIIITYFMSRKFYKISKNCSNPQWLCSLQAVKPYPQKDFINFYLFYVTYSRRKTWTSLYLFLNKEHPIVNKLIGLCLEEVTQRPLFALANTLKLFTQSLHLC